ncbi:chemotaxis methyl-accepting receptor [Lucifera butyrica]|uniref:Chemotaxis methyl-accepting receptor n=1 Tax=Lucifera butyrica TaxID=1351585 RepID=A0A498RBE7_9FIRM|nr:methyl-accepting chemotaxis protein [Lucifera butyrica]VBB07602.1 chemotaxis methyl-accepting receptor [Lucifera butyrica]
MRKVSLAALTIGQKIYLILTLVSFVAIVVGTVGLIGIGKSNESLHIVYKERVVPLKQLKMVSDMYSINIVNTCQKVKNGYLSWAEGIKNIKEARKVIKLQWDNYKSIHLSPQEKAIVIEAEPWLKRADLSAAKVLELMQARDRKELENYTITELYPTVDPIAGKIEKLVDLQLEGAKQEYDTAQKNYFLFRNLFMVLLGGGISLALFIAFFIIGTITTPLQRMLDNAQAVAAGNLAIQSIHVKSQDEVSRLGAAFNSMTGNLRQLVTEVALSAGRVAASSEQLTANAEQSAQAAGQVAGSISGVAAGTEKQLNSVDTAMTVVEQMSVQIQTIAANAAVVSDASAQTAKAAKDGGKIVDMVSGKMSEIEATVNQSTAIVTELKEYSRDIGRIVETITGIAGQTNLLALNAAIEAARAGKEGRGFAVVAEEVRLLAEQSQLAAKQIVALIATIQGNIDKAVAAMAEGTCKVKSGTETVTIAGQAFTEVVRHIEQVSDQVKDIAASIQQIAGGSRQIVGSVQEIDQISRATAAETQAVSAATEEQAAAMEEIASASDALAKMAQKLQQAVNRFSV